MRKAFTLIELIITMVILSIVAYVASGLIAKTYIGYNQTNSINRANLKVELAISEIANRLEYAISNTIIKRKDTITNKIFPINAAPTDYGILEWIGYDKDSFEASTPPGWSAFCDIKQSAQSFIITPGSNLNIADSTIKNLSATKASLSLPNKVAIFFPGNYSYKNIGFFGINLPFIPGESTSGTTLVLNYFNGIAPYYLTSKLIVNNPSKRIVEQYKLAWSAYAVVPNNCKTGDNNEKICDLELRYNYRPWNNEDYTQAESSLLVNNVTVFKTYATQNRIHIKLCIEDKYLGGKTISICKEKVVYR